MSKNWSYWCPTRVQFGEDCLATLDASITAIAPETERVAILCGSSATQRGAALDTVIAQLGDRKVEVFESVPAEPSQGDVIGFAHRIEQARPQILLAIGGGSVIDTAKLCALVIGRPLDDLGPIMDREVAPISKFCPVVAVPTTAGSGSEVTPFAVVTNPRTNLKQSLPTPFNYPELAFVQPEFLTTVPATVIGDSGMDALAHALEALWSIHHNPVSDALAVRAAALALDYLRLHYKDPESPEPRKQMALAAMLAGRAFSNTFTAACHAISYPLSARFHLSHGAGCALTLHAIADLNEDAVEDDYEVIKGLQASEEAAGVPVPEQVQRLRDDLPTIPTLASLGATSTDMEFVADNAFAPLLANNPTPLAPTQIARLLDAELRRTAQGS